MPRKKLRICEAEFRRLWAAGWSRPQLAEHFDCSVSWIDNYRMGLALPVRQRKNPRESFSPFDPTPERSSSGRKNAGKFTTHGGVAKANTPRNHV
jgi:hypothetical protein